MSTVDVEVAAVDNTDMGVAVALLPFAGQALALVAVQACPSARPSQ
jgi:hypothetical protein